MYDILYYTVVLVDMPNSTPLKSAHWQHEQEPDSPHSLSLGI